MGWLGDWANRMKITIDSNKIDSDLTDFPVMIHLASGTGILNQDVSDVFYELGTTNSGTIDSYTKFLSHCQGDLSPANNTAIIYGGAKITSDEAKLSTHSVYFAGAGSGDYMELLSTVDYGFDAGDFTIECWVKLPASGHGSDARIMGNWLDSWGSNRWSFHNSQSNNQNKLTFWINNYSAASPLLTGSTPLHTDQWIHVAVTRSGNNFYMFHNGNLEASASTSVSLEGGGSNTIYITGNAINVELKGYVDGIRISKGIARWTSSFTPPTTPYTTTSGIDSYTKAYWSFQGDLSETGHDIEYFGSTDLRSTNGPFDNMSYFFNESPDYLHLSGHTDFMFGAEDFTLDYWVRIPVTGHRYQFSGDGDKYWLLAVSQTSTTTMGLWLGDTASWTETSGRYDYGTHVITDNNWHHVALVRYGDNFKVFIDGEVDINKDVTPGYSVPGSSIYVGIINGVGTGYFSGYMAEIRISKGVARWTKSFDPPNAPYPNYTEFYEYYPKKIAITKPDGITQQYVEIEHWNPWKREATLWTGVSGISSSTDTDLYLYYDSSQADNYKYVGDTGEIVAQRVWDDDFVAVYHMAQDPSGGLNSIKDSTSNSHSGTPNGSMTTEDLVDAGVGKGIDFDGSNDYIAIGSNIGFNPADPTYVGTIEAISTFDGSGSHLASNPRTDTYQRFGLVKVTSTGKLFFSSINKPGGPAPYSYLVQSSISCPSNPNNFNYFALVSDVPGDSWHFRINSETEDLSGYYMSGDSNPLVTDVDIQRFYNHTYSEDYSSEIVSELRFSSVKRSDAWLKASYYSNLDNLLTFDTSVTPSFGYSGYVQVAGSPARRRVGLYNRSTMELVAEGYSDPSTGYFILYTPYNGYHFSIILPELDDSYNLIASDKINPEN